MPASNLSEVLILKKINEQGIDSLTTEELQYFAAMDESKQVKKALADAAVLRIKKKAITGDSFKKGTALDTSYSSRVEGKGGGGEYLSPEERKARFKKTTITGAQIRGRSTGDPGGALVKTSSSSALSSDLLKNVNKIGDTTQSIQKVLTDEYQFRKTQEDKERQSAEQENRSGVEKGLEAPGGGGFIGAAAKKVLGPVKSVFDKIMDFLMGILLGNVLMKLIDWFGDPANQKKIDSVFKFIKDWWPALVAGLILFGGALLGPGGLILGIVALAIGFVPKLIDATKSLLGFGKKAEEGAKKSEKTDRDNQKRVGGVGTPQQKELPPQDTEAPDLKSEPGKEEKEEKKPPKMEKGGIINGPSHKNGGVPIEAEGGEFVMTRDAVKKYGVSTLESMNAAAGGTNKPEEESDDGIGGTLRDALMGAGKGALAGLLIGGPMGALVGAVGGGILGATGSDLPYTGILPSDPEHVKKGEPTDPRVSKEKKLRFEGGGVVPASHSATGSGYQPSGVVDEQGRPAVFSQGGADAFARMVAASGGQVSGRDIASSQRSPSWNAKVGGVSNSNHLFGNALDIHGSSQSWMRQHGSEYGWIVNDYPGSHGGHFNYKGGGAGKNKAVDVDQATGQGEGIPTTRESLGGEKSAENKGWEMPSWLSGALMGAGTGALAGLMVGGPMGALAGAIGGGIIGGIGGAMTGNEKSGMENAGLTPGPNIVLAPKGGEEGYLDKGSGEWTKGKWSDSEKKRYEQVKAGTWAGGSFSSSMSNISGSQSGGGMVLTGGAGAAIPFSEDLTETQRKALGVLAKYESGAAGYDAVNQIGTRGGRGVKGFSGDFREMSQHGGVSLTDLTIGQIKALQYDDKTLSNQQWIDAGKLHATGRYQFIGNTLPGVAQRAGLGDDVKYDAAAQDRMALQLMKERGISPWVGPSDKASNAERAIIQQAIQEMKSRPTVTAHKGGMINSISTTPKRTFDSLAASQPSIGSRISPPSSSVSNYNEALSQMEQSGGDAVSQELPSIDAGAMRSQTKIRTLGISV